MNRYLLIEEFHTNEDNETVSVDLIKSFDGLDYFRSIQEIAHFIIENYLEQDHYTKQRNIKLYDPDYIKELEYFIEISNFIFFLTHNVLSVNNYQMSHTIIDVSEDVVKKEGYYEFFKIYDSNNSGSPHEYYTILMNFLREQNINSVLE